MHALSYRIKGRHLLGLLAVVIGLAFGVSPGSAQTDVIRGKVTGPDALPLQGVRVTATSIPGNVTRSAMTDRSGNFQIAFPNGTGDYFMGYAMFGYSYKQFQIKRVADEDVLIADARMTIVQLDSIVGNASMQQRPNRFEAQRDPTSTERTVQTTTLTADQQGDIAAMAASLPGVLLVPGLDGDPAGFSVMGLGPDANTVTLNGVQTDANGLPRDAQMSGSLTTSSYDPSRGGFSGANFNIRPRSGSNYISRGLSLVTTTPQMQWTDRAAQALANDYTNISVGGMMSGPIKLNKAFFNTSFELARQSRDNLSLVGGNALGLQTAGVAIDSVSRFIGILGDRGVPTILGSEHSNRVNDRASMLASVDISPPNSTTGQSFGFTLNGSYNRQTPVSGGITQLESAGGDRKSWSGGLQGRHSGYFGLILSETSAGFNLSHDSDDPYLNLPSGRVRVSSVFTDGSNSVQNLVFGGNQGMGTSTQSKNASFSNTLSWFDNNNKHRIKLGSELRFSSTTSDQSSNLLGGFVFNSLEDLQAGIPASFTRTLSQRERSSGQFTGMVSLGDSYRHTPDLQFQGGIRIDANAYTKDPERNALVESTFGRRNDDVPTPITISPRLGFSWTVGKSNEIAAFSGAFVAPRAVIRGGIGMFASNYASGQITQVLDNTGLPSGIQQIVCTGPAAPIPDWASYANDPSSIPDRCADGTSGTVFSNGAPNVTLFAKDYAPSKRLSGDLSWNGAILDSRFTLNVTGTYSLNQNQQRSVDLNFAPTSRFTLADDGRPVFVEPTSIVATTGAIASRDSRVSQSFARVTELRSDLESRTGELKFQLSPIIRTPTKFGWNLAYTYTNIREQVSGFSSTAGDPLSVEWARSGQGPHAINYSLRYRFFDAVDVSWNGQLRSGSAFTPTVAGDINGDGYSNDRAFIYSPDAVADPDLAAGMQQLLVNTSDRTRDCLMRQMGRIADRNSCRTPWTSSASLNITLDRAKFRMPDRAGINFSVSNPLGAADLLMNGSGGLRGWGQSPITDQSLLYVRGFDETTRQYKFEVNERFGATRPQFITLRSPVTLTASVKYDLGPTREKQQLNQQLAFGRSTPGSRMPVTQLRMTGAYSIPNPVVQILRSQDSLRLTREQADSLAVLSRRFAYKSDSLWTPVAKYLAALPEKYDEEEAYGRFMDARRQQLDMLVSIVKPIRELLTPTQRRKIPSYIVTYLDPRYLAHIRNGTGLYVGTGGGGPVFYGGGEMMVFEAAGGMMIH